MKTTRLIGAVTSILLLTSMGFKSPDQEVKKEQTSPENESKYSIQLKSSTGSPHRAELTHL